MASDAIFLDQLLAAVAAVRLDVIVVGNVASILHGAPVTTQDIDLLIRDTPLNRKKLVALAKALRLTPPEPISDVTRTLRMSGAAAPVDFLLDQIGGGLKFTSVKARAVRIRVDEQTAVVASLEDVIESKQAANRPKDRAMLPILRDTLRIKKALAAKEK